MLTFFRKNQKVIFVFTTAVIVVSFTFFGTMNPMGDSSGVKEDLLVKAVDGSAISSQKVHRMVQFLSSSHLDLRDDRIQSVNLLNNGVLEKQFLRSSFGKLLAEKISLEIESDIARSVEKAVSFESYRHPGAPFISAEAVWSQFSPEAAKIVRDLTLQSSSLSTVKKFTLLSQAYLQHQTIPAQFIKRIISYQAQQMAHSESDSSLAYADVSLLGLHSVKEWIGESYLKAASQVIINGAAYARKLGYKVSSQEARQAMVLNVQEAAKLLSKDKPIQANPYQLFLVQVRNLGINEQECIDLWKDIALFQKLLDSASSSVDVLNLPEIQNISKDQALVEKFTLPSSLQFRDFTSFMKLQVYLDAISLKKRSKEDLLSFPTEFLSIAEIEKKSPDLIQKDYVLEFAELDLKKAASQIGLKETWSWQTQEEGWSLLRKEFSELSKSLAKTQEDRFKDLEALDSKKRGEVDRFSREQILSRNKERIKKELDIMTPENRSFSISPKGFELPFKGISDMQELVSLLEVAPLKGEKEVSSESRIALEKMSFYTGNSQNYYKISVVERSPHKKIQTFAEASESGSLRRMLDKKLEDSYFEIRKRDSMPYMKKDGSWKPLAEVKEKVGLALYAPVLKSIVSEYTGFYGKEPTKEQLESTEFYVKNWMLSYMKESLAKARAGALVRNSGSLDSQWALHQEKETLVKKEHESLTGMKFIEGEWSSVLSLSSNKLCFFKIVQNLAAAEPSKEEIEKVSAPLKREAEEKLFEKLFSEIEAKKAISFKVSL